ncbi:MAG: DUF6906 family protein [Cetobacterium sp.]
MSNYRELSEIQKRFLRNLGADPEQFLLVSRTAYDYTFIHKRFKIKCCIRR